MLDNETPSTECVIRKNMFPFTTGTTDYEGTYDPNIVELHRIESLSVYRLHHPSTGFLHDFLRNETFHADLYMPSILPVPTFVTIR